MGISWYDETDCTVGINIEAGDCHGPDGPRNDKFEGAQHCKSCFFTIENS